ncbi:hypothetical protein C9J85_04930 [Haloferax sp. wsp5]|nr:hypothetical protein C9J85_04930 [Haloferax sp. wsp5]
MSTSTSAELTAADASLMADWVRAGFNTSARATVETRPSKRPNQTLTVTRRDRLPPTVRLPGTRQGASSRLSTAQSRSTASVPVTCVLARDLPSTAGPRLPRRRRWGAAPAAERPLVWPGILCPRPHSAAPTCAAHSILSSGARAHTGGRLSGLAHSRRPICFGH